MKVRIVCVESDDVGAAVAVLREAMGPGSVYSVVVPSGAGDAGAVAELLRARGPERVKAVAP